jgi:hypothetical protein
MMMRVQLGAFVAWSRYTKKRYIIHAPVEITSLLQATSKTDYCGTDYYYYYEIIL